MEVAVHVMTTTYFKLKRMEIKKNVEDKRQHQILSLCKCMCTDELVMCSFHILLSSNYYSDTEQF
jgi:hypothetical protein